jgi:hypothetical protein
VRKEIKGPAWIARMRRHRHNGYSGHARMMEMQLRAIIESDSTSAYTKDIARTMLNDIPELKASLKTRIDP